MTDLQQNSAETSPKPFCDGYHRKTSARSTWHIKVKGGLESKVAVETRLKANPHFIKLVAQAESLCQDFQGASHKVSAKSNFGRGRIIKEFLG